MGFSTWVGRSWYFYSSMDLTLYLDGKISDILGWREIIIIFFVYRRPASIYNYMGFRSIYSGLCNSGSELSFREFVESR